LVLPGELVLQAEEVVWIQVLTDPAAIRAGGKREQKI